MQVSVPPSRGRDSHSSPSDRSRVASSPSRPKRRRKGGKGERGKGEGAEPEKEEKEGNYIYVHYPSETALKGREFMVSHSMLSHHSLMHCLLTFITK